MFDFALWLAVILYFAAVSVFLFCFALRSFLVNMFPHFSCFLTFVDMFNIEKQFLQRLDQWNECVCMYVYTLMYVSMFVCIHNICMYACMKVGIYIYVLYMYVYIIYNYAYMCLRMCICVCYICMYTFMCIYIYVCINSYICN